MTAERVNWEQLRSWLATCQALGIDAPVPAVKALHLISVAESMIPDPVGPLLDLDDQQLRARVEQISVRAHAAGKTSGFSGLSGLRPGFEAIQSELAVEVLEACAGDLDRIVAERQDEFAKLAEPLVRGAQDFNFSIETTSDDVILMADEAASEAWRGVRRAWQSIGLIVRWRIELAKVFHQDRELQRASTDQDIRHELRPPNWSALFSESNWSTEGGYYVEAKTIGSLDWLAMGASGLKLCTPSEVSAKVKARVAEQNRISPSQVIDDPWDDDLDTGDDYTYPPIRKQ